MGYAVGGIVLVVIGLAGFSYFMRRQHNPR